MQYILTEEEYGDLVPIDERTQRIHALESARKLIIKHSKFPCGETYCDQCPISLIDDIFDEQKNPIISRRDSKLICGKYRQYSK